MYNVDEIKKLSQEDGLNDRQISEILGCSRVTITRIRKRNGISTCDLESRMDKTYICAKCHTAVYIRRRDRRRHLCPECLEKAKRDVLNR